MDNGIRIPTEIIQLLSANQAWRYMLVPYDISDKLYCYGNTDIDYSDVKAEVETLLGYTMQISVISNEELLKKLNTYYRPDGSFKSKSPASSGVEFFQKLINEAYANYASDVHFEPYEEQCRIRMRIDGKLIERYVLKKGEYATLINQIKISACLDIAEKRLPQDGRIMYKNGSGKFDIRVSSLPTIYGEKLVLRLLTRHLELLDINNLGFTPKQLDDYKKCVSNPHGMVLITGPTGSGKSTTLYATLLMLNKDTSNILTIEDPIEYTLHGVNQVQLKEEIGLTFPNALRTFLRQDPDIIMLGEIRDPDTAQMAIRSSLTGHLILSTLHTNSAFGAVSRLRDMNIHPYLLSSTLLLCVSQRLVRLLCKSCKSGNSPTGCAECYYTGYKGRKAIYEVIPIDDQIREMIKNGSDKIDDYLNKKGITTIKESALALYEQKETSYEEILPIVQSL